MPSGALPLERGYAVAAVLAAMLACEAGAAPVPFPVATTAARLDGVPLGSPLHPSSQNSLRFTVAFDPSDSQFHLWVLNGGDSQSPADMQVADITHATSVDGVAFTSRGKLNPPAGWWTQIPGVGAINEPSVNFLRIDRIGSAWYLTIWSPNEVDTGRYNYNANVWYLGPDANNLDVVQRGPLPSLADAPIGPGGNMVGSFGMVAGNIYLRQDTQFDSGTPIVPPAFGGGLGRYVFTDGTRPALSGLWGTSEADLFASTPYCWMLPAAGPNQCTAFPSRTAAYVHNSGRTIAQGAALSAYYTFRDWTTAARLAKQIYYAESADNGLSWSVPGGIYTNGNAVLVDGLPNAAAFSSPEIASNGAGHRAYFSTADVCGNTIVVTNDNASPPQGPTIGKSFGATSVAVGAITTLTVTLAAPAPSCSPAPTNPVFTNAGFTDALPAGLVVASPALVANTCGGTVTAVPGAATFGLAGAGIAPGSSCSVTVNVRVVAPGNQTNSIPRSGGSASAAGFYNDQTAAAVADASAQLIVNAQPHGATDIPALSPAMLMLLAVLVAVTVLRGPRAR